MERNSAGTLVIFMAVVIGVVGLARKVSAPAPGVLDRFFVLLVIVLFVILGLAYHQRMWKTFVITLGAIVLVLPRDGVDA